MHRVRQILNDCIMCVLEDSHVSRTLRKVSVRRKGAGFQILTRAWGLQVLLAWSLPSPGDGLTASQPLSRLIEFGSRAGELCQAGWNQPCEGWRTESQARGTAGVHAKAG